MVLEPHPTTPSNDRRSSFVRSPGEPITWRVALRSTRFRRDAVLSLLALIGTLLGLSRFLLWVEERPGTVVLADPVLAQIPARDLSVPTFALIYGGILLGLVVLLRHPRRLLWGVQSYVLLVLFRIVLMWVTPLAPPRGFVPLVDPVVETFGPAKALTRDLFFSGHTSTLFLLTLLLPRPWKLPMLGAASGVAVLLLLQHAHYTVDVLIAMFCSFAASVLAARLTPPAVD